ncbi:hypothetical protein EHJ09_02515 [Cronobacter turicensis]|nr:hypothetical protein [Cronobacter turicensis]
MYAAGQLGQDNLTRAGQACDIAFVINQFNKHGKLHSMDIYTVLAHYSARMTSGKVESEGVREEA